MHWEIEFFPQRIKRQGREVNSWPTYNEGFKNAWSHTCTSPYAFMACTESALQLPYTYFLLLYLSTQLAIKQQGRWKTKRRKVMKRKPPVCNNLQVSNDI
jgi:hypothetical protein